MSIWEYACQTYPVLIGQQALDNKLPIQQFGLATFSEVQCSMALSPSMDIETHFQHNFHIKTHQDGNLLERLLAEKTLAMRARFNIPYAGVKFLHDSLVELAVQAASFKVFRFRNYKRSKSYQFFSL